jgi:hypothetical protein
MIEITKNEAIDKVVSEKYVCIIWVKGDCPSCKHFETLIDNIVLDKDATAWNFYKVDVEKIGGSLYFEPSIYPTNYVFSEGVRKVVAIGVAMSGDVTSTLSAIESNTFKTDEEIEQEQLDALDK